MILGIKAGTYNALHVVQKGSILAQIREYVPNTLFFVYCRIGVKYALITYLPQGQIIQNLANMRSTLAAFFKVRNSAHFARCARALRCTHAHSTHLGALTCVFHC
jgi:hypothetical protein